MEYTVQWGIIVEILGEILGLVHNDVWHKALPISLGKYNYRAPECCLFSSFHFPH